MGYNSDMSNTPKWSNTKFSQATKRITHQHSDIPEAVIAYIGIGKQAGHCHIKNLYQFYKNKISLSIVNTSPMHKAVKRVDPTKQKKQFVLEATVSLQ